MKKRSATINRVTKETNITGRLVLEGKGNGEVTTGIGFLDHMLQLFARHGAFDLKLQVRGDLNVDQHHTVEDTGLVLGQLFDKSLGNRVGINRAGYFIQTMDETLAVAAIDLGGRATCVYQDRIRARQVGNLTTELLPDFFEAFAGKARANVHVKVLYGRSSHHQVEAIFKCFARALRFACSRDEQLQKQLPSTKGLL